MSLAVGAAPEGRGYRVFHLSMLLVAALALGTIGVAAGMGVWYRLSPDSRVSGVRQIAGGSSVAGGSSLIIRGDDGIELKYVAAGLPVGHVVSLRAEIFNHPEKCTHGERGSRCGAADLGDAAVDGSVVYLSSVWARQRAAIPMDVKVAKGDGARAVLGGGLTNPRGADVHVVLMDHGAPAAGQYAQLVGTLGGGCKSPPYAAGTAGSLDCADLQYANHDR